MILLNYSKNYLRSRFFLINSLPKSGTHLLCKAVKLFPGMSSRYVHIGRSTLGQFEGHVSVDVTVNGTLSESPTLLEDGNIQDFIPVGVDWPAMVSLDKLEKKIYSLKLRQLNYATCHFPFHTITEKSIQKMCLDTLLILRDPRDIVISHAKYILNREAHFLHDYYKTLTESEQIMVSIRGVSNVTAGKDSVSLLSIQERFRSIEPWMKKTYNYTTYFEKLIGVQGGGTAKMQREELINIARHLGIAYKDADIDKISRKLFGGTITFNQGKIGSWRNKLSEEHKQTFKEVSGQLLIDLGYEHNFDW